MAGPCRSTSSPVIRLRPELVGPGQLDLFRRVVAAAPGGLRAGESVPGLEHVEELLLDEQVVRILFVRRAGARQFRLTLRSRGEARCTLPPQTSLPAAQQFVHWSRDWLARKVAALPEPSPEPPPLGPGDEYWIDGRPVRITSEPAAAGIRLGEWVVPDVPSAPDLRPTLEGALRRKAAQELRERTAELAGRLGLRVPRISIRHQRSRWGSCSTRGTVSLNWRLIQLPPEVRNYVILHEVLHLRHPGHTPRFWAEVRRVCPGWAASEAWLRQNGTRFLSG